MCASTASGSRHPQVEGIVDYLANRLSAGDTVVIMSSGSFDGLHDKLLSRLGDGVTQATLDDPARSRACWSASGCRPLAFPKTSLSCGSFAMTSRLLLTNQRRWLSAAWGWRSMAKPGSCARWRCTPAVAAKGWAGPWPRSFSCAHASAA